MLNKAKDLKHSHRKIGLKKIINPRPSNVAPDPDTFGAFLTPVIQASIASSETTFLDLVGKESPYTIC